MRPGSNAVEATKASKNGNGLLIREDLPALIEKGHAALTTSEKDLLKWVGVFFPQAYPERVHDAGSHAQRFCELRSAPCYCRSVAQAGQVRAGHHHTSADSAAWFSVGQRPGNPGASASVNLHSLQTGMDNVRNINGCPLAGGTLNELFDASLTVQELDDLIVGPGGNPEFCNLPGR